MSLRGPGVINRWRERHRSYSGISSTSTATSKPQALRPSTSYAPSATPSAARSAAYNRDFEKIVEDAVLHAFNSDVFKTAIASQIEPHLSKQHEKINQLKTANLNFESNVQTQLEDIPLMLQPALDHLTNLEIPNYEKELTELLTGQKALADSIVMFDGRLTAVETQVQDFDGRVKALQEEVVSADLRSAIRFGEISNELQDRNSTFGDRLWNVERDLGQKIDGQQRRVVGACEDLRKAIVITQDKISSLETMHIGFDDKLTSNGERSDNLFKKIEQVSKSISKLDSADIAIQRDIKAVQETVSSLDTSPLDHIPRRLDGMDRAMSDLKRSIETQATLASLDAKIASGNNARIDTLSSNVGKMGKLMEDVHQQVCDDSEFDFTTEKLESIESKIVSLDDALEGVRKNVKTLDTSPLFLHTEKLENLKSSVSQIETAVALIDSKHFPSQNASLDLLKTDISALQSTLDTGFSSEKNNLEMIQNHLSLLPDSPKIDSIVSALESNHAVTTEKFDGLENTLGMISNIATLTSEALSSHSDAFDSAFGTIVSLHHETTSKFEPLGSSITAIGKEIGSGNDAVAALGTRFEDILAKQEDHVASIADVKSRVGSGNDVLKSLTSQVDLIVTKSDAHHALLTEVKENDKSAEIITTLSRGEKSQVEHFKILGQNIEATKMTVESTHESTLSEMRQQTDTISSGLVKSKESHLAHTASFAEAKASQEKRYETLDGYFSALNAAVAKSHTAITNIQGTVDSMLPELESSKISHSDHAASLSEILDLNKLHATSLSDIHGTSGEIVRGLEKSHVAAGNHSSTLGELAEAVSRKDDIGDLHAMLSTILEGLDKHASSLKQLSTTESIAELKSDISSAHDSRKDDLADLHGILSTVLEAMDKHSNGLQQLSTSEAVLELKGEISASRDLLTAHSTTLSDVKSAVTDTAILDATKNINTSVDGVADRIDSLDAELKASFSLITSLGEANKSSLQGVRSTLETSDISHAIKAILDGTISNKHLLESNSSRTDSNKILEEARSIKTAVSEFRSSSREKEILSELSSVKDMVQRVPENCKTEELLAQIKSAIDLSERNRASLALALESLKSINDDSSSSKILADLGNLTSLVEDSRATRQESEILKLVESVNGTINKHTSSMQEIHDDVRHVKDHTSSIAEVKDITLDVQKHISDVYDDVQHVKHQSSFITEVKETILDVQKHTISISEVHDDVRKGREENSASSSHALTEMNAIKQNGTQQAATLARTYDALLAVDTKIKTSEDFIYAAVQELHSTMERELADNRSSIATSVEDVASDLKIDLQGLGSRFATSTNVLRADLKLIDLAPMQTVLGQLKEDVQSIREVTAGTAENVAAIPASFTATHDLLALETTKTSELIVDLTKLVKSHGDLQRGNSKAIEEKINQNAATLSNIDQTTSRTKDSVSGLIKVQLPKISEDIRAIDLSKIASETAETVTTLAAVGHSIEELIKTAQIHVTELSNTKEQVSKTTEQILTQLSSETSKLIDITRGVESSVQTSSLETNTAVKENTTMLSRIHKTVEETPSNVETSLIKETALLAEAIRAVNEELSKEATRSSKSAKSNATALATITADISNLTSSTESKISTLHTDLTTTHIPQLMSEICGTRTALEASNSFSFNALSADLKTVTSAISTTSTAVRVNSAAISRVDKAVLETGAHVKGVIYEGNRQLSSEIESALSQLDESLHDNGTRIRGISEYDIPRMETEIRTLDQSLERSIRTSERSKDALTVIGGRIIGTSKKFGEMVDAAQRGELENGHGLGNGGGHGIGHSPQNSLRGSRILGSVKGELGMGSGRFRRASNASSSKDGSRIMNFPTS